VRRNRRDLTPDALPPEGQRDIGAAVLLVLEPINERAQTHSVTKRRNKRVEFWCAECERLMAEVDAILPRALELKAGAPGSAEDDAYAWRLLTLAHTIMVMAEVVGDEATRDEFVALANDVWDESAVSAKIEDEQPDDMAARLFERAAQMAIGLT
jgi:hypothetical protein